MQYNKDMDGTFSNIFKKARDIVLSFDGIKELKNQKQTSYSDLYGVVVMMRGKENMFVLSFGKGAKLQDDFAHLSGDGKIVRHWNLYSKKDLNEKVFRQIIKETMILNMEYYELKKLRCNNNKF